MLAYLIRRLFISIPLLLGILCLSFLMLKLAPGEPTIIQQDLQARATGAQRETLRQLYGLDQPLHVQFGRWLWRVVRLDFGRSYMPDGRPVLDKITERIPITLGLNLLELLIIFFVAVPLGILSATRQYSAFDKSMTLFVFVGFATPDFWLALLMMILFGVQLGWLPMSGLRSLNFEYLDVWAQAWDVLSHLILPVLVASFGGLAYLSRLMRGSLLEVIRQDYIRTARAKGLPEGEVIYKHAVRNAVIPVVTLLGLMLPGLLGGSVFIETVFAIPGMGQLFVQSAFSRDEPVLMALVVIGASLSLLGNILADVSYGLVDPRIRVSGREAR
ncbi:MAG: ABC transporter permease [candidate division NC10 bacterium]|nr:ABC transporter permease [candidate division NC10 bacterium]MBI4840056.1 ABC transporter permease [candidate division NC10 bacterium]